MRALLSVIGIGAVGLLIGCGGILTRDPESDAAAEASPVCPVEPPIHGTVCVGELECPYDRCPAFRARARCSAGTWRLESTVCNVGASCPSEKPREGSSCAGGGSLECEYGAKTCGDELGIATYECIDSRWRARVTTPSCPSIVPLSGTPCDECENNYGQRCTSPCEGGEQYVYECPRDTLQWKTTKSSCM